jgi:hypothetical protein
VPDDLDDESSGESDSVESLGAIHARAGVRRRPRIHVDLTEDDTNDHSAHACSSATGLAPAGLATPLIDLTSPIEETTLDEIPSPAALAHDSATLMHISSLPVDLVETPPVLIDVQPNAHNVEDNLPIVFEAANAGQNLIYDGGNYDVDSYSIDDDSESDSWPAVDPSSADGEGETDDEDIRLTDSGAGEECDSEDDAPSDKSDADNSTGRLTRPKLCDLVD